MRRTCSTALIGALLLVATHLASAAGEPSLTFFGWSDQHVQTDGDGSHLIPAIEAMNALPGTPYPESIGGRVEKPALVFGCGDITEWPTTAAKNTYAQLITERLKFPAYDIAGNHDEGGNSPSETIKRWLVARHGALSYRFDAGGVRFLAVFSKYDESLQNPAQPLTEEALAFIRTQLSEVPANQPVIIATHLCFDAMTNRDALVDTIGGANVLAVLGGHYHKAKIDRYRGVNFIQLPSPAPGSPGEIMVLRVTGKRWIAATYNYRQRQWSNEPKKLLDTAMETPD